MYASHNRNTINYNQPIARSNISFVARNTILRVLSRDWNLRWSILAIIGFNKGWSFNLAFSLKRRSFCLLPKLRLWVPFIAKAELCSRDTPVQKWSFPFRKVTVRSPYLLYIFTTASRPRFLQRMHCDKGNDDKSPLLAFTWHEYSLSSDYLTSVVLRAPGCIIYIITQAYVIT